MSNKLVLLTYDLRAGTNLADYDRFMREVDYPVFRQRPEVRAYRAYRVAQNAQGALPFDHFDLLEVDDFGDVDAIFGHPSIADHAGRWVEHWSAHGPDAPPEQNFGITLCDPIE